MWVEIVASSRTSGSWHALEVLFWVSAAAVLFAYAGYPLLVWALSRLLGHSSSPEDVPEADLPTVSLLIAAHNEEAMIEQRILNALEMDYPREKLEIVVASDGSDDETDELVRRYADRGVRLLGFTQRRGKAAVINSVIPQLRGRLVLLSDANTFTERGALRSMARWFADERVGVVCGRLVLTDSKSGKNVDGVYWKFETFLKKQEGRLGALLGANGAIYAIRKELFCPIPNDTIIDDFVIPLLAKSRSGCEIVYDTDAVAHEESAPSVEAEFRRRARIGAGGWQAIGILRSLLHPGMGWVSFTFWSHKILRWLCPFFLIGLLVSSLALRHDPFYWTALLVQIAGYAAAWLGECVPRWVPMSRVLRLANMFVQMNTALLVGFFRWAGGRQGGTWARTARAAELEGAGPSAPPARRRDFLLALLLSAGAMLVMGDAWWDIRRLAFVNEELSYLLLAPVMIVIIAWVRRGQAQFCRLQGQWLGIALTVLGWLIYWYGYYADPVLWRAGAVLTAVGAFVAIVGSDVLLRFLPAFAATAFLIPISPNGRYRLAVPLQEATAQATQSVCDILGIYVDRAGNMLTINGVDVAVAEACNGMRMVLTLLLVCYVVAFTLSLRTHLRLLVLAASPLIAVIANVTRLVPTVWLFGNSSREAAEGFHDVSGWGMTVVAFLVLMGFFRLLERIAGQSESGPSVIERRRPAVAVAAPVV